MRTTIISLVLTAILVMMSGCDLLWGSAGGDVAFTLKNSSDEDVHLWISGESIGPSNKVSPGGKRSAYKSFVDDEGKSIYADDQSAVVTVYAGRNGSVITSEIYEMDANKSSKFTVSFNGSSLSGGAR